jgi:tetratricopeptide (TPR) repeat protein
VIRMPSRSFARVCFAVAALSIVAFGADQSVANLDFYLPKDAAEKSTYSPGKQVDRFRSYARLDKAYRLIQNQQLERAKQELRPLIEQSPENWRACSVYLSLLYRTGDYAQLIKQADLTLGREAHFIPALLYRSRAYAAMERFTEAAAGYETLARQPGLLPADLISVLQTLGDLYIRAKEYPLAVSTSTRELELRASFSAWFREGLAFDGMNHPEEAEHAYRRALELSGPPAQRVSALRGIAEALRKAGKWSSAEQTILQALQIVPDDVVLLRSLAETEYQLRNYEQAERWLRRLLLVRQNVLDREFLAEILLLRKNWSSAETEFKALLAETSEPRGQAKAYRALSLIEETKGNPSQSADYLKRALALEPSFSGREKLANLLVAQGSLVEADEVLRGLVTEARVPADKHRVLLVLGQVKMSERQFAAAAEAFSVASGIEDDAVTLAFASNAAEQAGDIGAAIEFTRRVAARTPSAEAYLRLGTLYEKRGDLPQAIANLETAANHSIAPGQTGITNEQSNHLSRPWRSEKTIPGCTVLSRKA